MLNGSYTQMTVKFPMSQERFRQAVECIDGRDRIKYRTQAEYLAAAILSFEGKYAGEQTSMNQIFSVLQELSRKVDELCDEKKNGG